MALKGKQGNLHEDVRLFCEDKAFMEDKVQDTFNDVTADHGRIEERTSTLIHDVDWLRQRHEQFHSLRSIIKIESLREFKNKPSAEVAKETRYYNKLCRDDSTTCFESFEKSLASRKCAARAQSNDRRIDHEIL